MGVQVTNQWLVIDQLREADVLRTLYEQLEQPAVERLYDGTAFDSLRTESPLVIDINASGADSLVRAFRDGLWRDSGMIIEGVRETPEVLAHLRSLVTVTPPGRLPSLFRFYSPRVLSGLRPALSDHDIARLLGGCQRWLWYSQGEQQQLIQPEHSACSLDPGQGFPMGEAHMNALRHAYTKEGNPA